MRKLLSTAAFILTLTVSGVAFTHDMGGHHQAFEAGLSKLPEKDAAQFRDTMKQAWEKDKPLMEKMHALHTDLKAIVTADKFDKDAFLAKHKEIADTERTLHDNMTEAHATALAALTQNKRKTLSEAMDHGPRGPGLHQGEHGAMHPKPENGSPAPEAIEK